MPVILVVEQDEGIVTRLRQSLGEAGGWRVRHVRSVREAMDRVASEAPDLFVVSTQVDGASSLLGPFARRQGGPGTLALAPPSADSSPGEGLGADAVLAKPVTGVQVLDAARKILRLGRAAAETEKQDTPKDEPKLTSNDIFGDLVAEVERGSGSPSRSPQPPRSPQPSQPPPPTPGGAGAGLSGDAPAGRDEPAAPRSARPGTPATPAARPGTPDRPDAPGKGSPERPAAPPRRLRTGDDIERRLEQTLSGVLSGTGTGRRGRPAKPKEPQQPPEPRREGAPPAADERSGPAERQASGGRPKAPSGSADVDALLSKTLSGLELPKRKKPAPPTRAQPPRDRQPTEEPPPAPADPPEPPPISVPPDDAPPSVGAGAAEDAPFDLGPAEPPEVAPPAEPPPIPAAPPDAPAEQSDPSFELSFDLEDDELTDAPAREESGTDLGEQLFADAPDTSGLRERKPAAETPAESPRIPSIPFEPQFADTVEEVPEPVGGVGAAQEAPVEGGEVPPSPPPSTEAPATAGGTEPPPPAEAGEGGRGTPFGQYRLLERIGVGGMAEVWKARMTGVEGFQKTVAIKKILPHLTDSTDFVDMFIDEAKLAAQLNHAHIIHIYDLGRIEGDYYIAMEYVEGENLRAILNAARERGRPMPVGLALYIAARLASGLDYAHKKRDFEDRSLDLVHRDVSPQNVLVGIEGTIKLCDFGIVKAVSKSSHTRMGALKGKLQYMSPEQAWGRNVDGRSDIFSIGALLFEMLTGRRLFTGDSEMEVLEAVRECRVQAPGDVDPGVPEKVDAIVLKALARTPDERFQSAGELARRLEEVLVSMRPSPGQAELSAYMRDLFDREDEAPPVPEPAGGPAQPTVPAPEGSRQVDEETARELVPPTTPSAPLTPEAPETPKQPEEAAPRDAAPAPTETDAAGAEPALEAVSPVTEVEPEEGGARGKGWLVAAIVALLVAAALLYWFVWRPRMESGPTAEPPAATAPLGAAGTGTGDEASSPREAAEGLEPTPDPSAEDGTPGASTADEGTADGAGEEGAAAGQAALPADVEERLDEELARREAELRRQYEETQRALAARIEAIEEQSAEPDEAEEDPEGGGSPQGSSDGSASGGGGRR